MASVCAALDAAAKFSKVFYDISRQEALSEASAQIKDAMIKHLDDDAVRLPHHPANRGKARQKMQPSCNRA